MYRFVFLLIIGSGLLASCVCFETQTDAKWEYVNNSNDSVVIFFTDTMEDTQSPSHFGSIVLLPMNDFLFTSTDWGIHDNYDCSGPFDERYIEYKVSGEKSLIKKIHIQGNWIHESNSIDKCSNSEKCTFIIEQSDISE